MWSSIDMAICCSQAPLLNPGPVQLRIGVFWHPADYYLSQPSGLISVLQWRKDMGSKSAGNPGMSLTWKYFKSIQIAIFHWMLLPWILWNGGSSNGTYRCKSATDLSAFLPILLAFIRLSYHRIAASRWMSCLWISLTISLRSLVLWVRDCF